MTPDAEMVERVARLVTAILAGLRKEPIRSAAELFALQRQGAEATQAALTALAPDFAALHARIAALEGENGRLRKLVDGNADPDAATGCGDDQAWSGVPASALRAAITPTKETDDGR